MDWKSHCVSVKHKENSEVSPTSFTIITKHKRWDFILIPVKQACRRYPVIWVVKRSVVPVTKPKQVSVKTTLISICIKVDLFFLSHKWKAYSMRSSTGSFGNRTEQSKH